VMPALLAASALYALPAVGDLRARRSGPAARAARGLGRQVGGAGPCDRGSGPWPRPSSPSYSANASPGPWHDRAVQPTGHTRKFRQSLAETVIGLFKTEVIHRRGPWRSLDAVEYATLEWVDWYNHRRLLAPIGDMPQAEAEARYYEQLGPAALAA